MDKYPVVVTGLVKYKDKFLIVKRNSNMEMYPNKWSFPGGKVIPGETLFETLKREIKEETNLDIENRKEFISDFSFQRPFGKSTMGFCFLVNAKHNNVKINEEFTDFTWITQNEINNYDLIQPLKTEIKKASKYKSF